MNERNEQYRQLLAQMSRARSANGVELDMLVEAIDTLLGENERLQARAQRLEDGLIQHLQQDLGIAPQEAL